MDAQKLYVLVPGDSPEYKPAKNFWFCSTCKRLASSEEAGNKCCQPRFCGCGVQLEQTPFTVCGDCQDKNVWEKAVEVEYDGGALYDSQSGKIHYNDEDLLAEYDGRPWDEVPEWFHPCPAVKWAGVNISDCLENSMQEFDDEGDCEKQIVDIDGLFTLVEEWNQKQTLMMLEPDHKQKVKLSKPDDWHEGP